MQKRNFLTLLLLFIFGASWAKNENLQLDEKHLKQDFEQINEIESYVLKNEGISYNELSKTNAFDLKNIQLEKSIANFSPNGDDPLLGIPAFWWGCCLGIIGVVLVIIMTDNDKPLVRKSLKGFLTTLGIIAGAYLIIIIGAIISSSQGY